MCGITGIASFNSNRVLEFQQLQKMCDTLIHRGPDDEGLEISNGVGLGMRRLSIIDLSGGRQPMYNEDHTVRVVFNGEIYNFREMRAELESYGHKFITSSDTEVIVHAYEEYGRSFVNKLNGMFAIALHDIIRKNLFLIRDPIGIKPLYYYYNKDLIVWGSEIKALLASGEVPRNLDIDSLGEFLAWEYVPGDGTLFKGIKKLKPGNMLQIDLTQPVCKAEVYWDVPDEEEVTSLSFEQWEEIISENLHRCVKRQMVSDVPLGAFLSGGVDSSLLTNFMGRAKTFSIGFDDPSYSELRWSKKVASHLGVSHEIEVIRPDVGSIFNHLLLFLDDPIGDFSIFPTFLVSRLARRYVTVCLSGDGGDELFGGYETYLANAYARRYRMFPSFIRNYIIEPAVNGLKPGKAKKGFINKAKRFVEGMQHSEDWSHARWRVFVGDSFKNKLLTKEAKAELNRPIGAHIEELFARSGMRDPLNKSLYVDLKSYLVDNILVKVDRMSMAVSLEARVPYLDTNLVELAFKMPARFKLNGKESKSILKRVASRYIPSECVYRSKEGFSIPIKNWLKTELRSLMEDLLAPSVLKVEGLFRVDVVEKLKKEHLASKANHSHILWSLMVFQGWRKQWLEA